MDLDSAGLYHGNYFTQELTIEYVCSGEYSQAEEPGISPLSADIDWSLCNQSLKAEFDAIVGNTPIITDKDKSGLSLAAWTADERSNQFLYSALGDK